MGPRRPHSSAEGKALWVAVMTRTDRFRMVICAGGRRRHDGGGMERRVTPAAIISVVGAEEKVAGERKKVSD
jgi:hypothetical protein